jgi:chromosome segregation ATPase
MDKAFYDMIEMEAPLLKRRLNPFLLISTVVVLSLLAGLSVLYQSELNDLVTDRKNLSSTLEEKNSQIADLESQVNNLSSRSSDLNQSVENLRTSLTQKINTLEQKNSTIDRLRESVAGNNDTIEALRQENRELNSTVRDMRLDFGTLCNKEFNNLTNSSQTTCEDYGFEP